MVDYDKYINSPKWDEIRREVIVRAKGFCEHCGVSSPLEVHHKHYDNLGAEKLDDLEALCASCHEAADEERVENTKMAREDDEADRKEKRFESWLNSCRDQGYYDDLDDDEMREKFEDFADD